MQKRTSRDTITRYRGGSGTTKIPRHPCSGTPLDEEDILDKPPSIFVTSPSHPRKLRHPILVIAILRASGWVDGGNSLLVALARDESLWRFSAAKLVRILVPLNYSSTALPTRIPLIDPQHLLLASNNPAIMHAVLHQGPSVQTDGSDNERHPW